MIKQALAWIAVGIAWVFVTRSFHATWTLDIIATSVLMLAFVTGTAVTRRLLRARNLSMGARWLALALVCAALGGVAAAIIRAFYISSTFGPFPTFPWHVNWGLDTFGVVVHVTVATWLSRLFSARQATAPGARDEAA